MINATQQQADDMVAELLRQRTEYVVLVNSGSIAVMSSILFIDAVLCEYVVDYVPDYSEISACTNVG